MEYKGMSVEDLSEMKEEVKTDQNEMNVFLMNI